jgi:hypothetical protein
LSSGSNLSLIRFRRSNIPRSKQLEPQPNLGF